MRRYYTINTFFLGGAQTKNTPKIDIPLLGETKKFMKMKKFYLYLKKYQEEKQQKFREKLKKCMAKLIKFLRGGNEIIMENPIKVHFMI